VTLAELEDIQLRYSMKRVMVRQAECEDGTYCNFAEIVHIGDGAMTCSAVISPLDNSALHARDSAPQTHPRPETPGARQSAPGPCGRRVRAR
jgi:hypothetical protein